MCPLTYIPSSFPSLPHPDHSILEFLTTLKLKFLPNRRHYGTFFSLWHRVIGYFTSNSLCSSTMSMPPLIVNVTILLFMVVLSSKEVMIISQRFYSFVICLNLGPVPVTNLLPLFPSIFRECIIKCGMHPTAAYTDAPDT